VSWSPVAPARPRSNTIWRASRHRCALLPLWVGLAAACGADAEPEPEPEPLEARFCRQLEACHYLVSGGSGACEEDTRRCVASLSGHDRREWASRTERCLNVTACAGFAECYLGSHPAC